MEAKTRVVQPQVRKCWKLPKLKEAGRSLSQSCQRGAALMTPWFQTSVLKNCGKINVWSLKPPHLWWFVKAVTEINREGKKKAPGSQGVTDGGWGGFTRKSPNPLQLCSGLASLRKSRSTRKSRAPSLNITVYSNPCPSLHPCTWPSRSVPGRKVAAVRTLSSFMELR